MGLAIWVCFFSFNQQSKHFLQIIEEKILFYCKKKYNTNFNTYIQICRK